MRASAEAARGLFDKEIDGFSIDSRAVRAGELFFALSPEDYRRHCFTATSFADAHRFIPEALGQRRRRGRRARGERRGRRRASPVLGPAALVEDVIDALQSVARGTIDAWGRPVVAVTGSAGKTTTKDLTAHVLGSTGRRVLRSRKNYNNELGVALSVLQMETDGARPEEFDVAVLEMGMSMPGEIARHCLVAPPDVAVLTLVAPVHLEFMGSVEAIAEGKAQLVEGMKRGRDGGAERRRRARPRRCARRLRTPGASSRTACRRRRTFGRSTFRRSESARAVSSCGRTRARPRSRSRCTAVTTSRTRSPPRPPP